LTGPPCVADIDITPNSTGLPGIDALRTIVGAVMTVGLILSVLALSGRGRVGFRSHSSNRIWPRAAKRAAGRVRRGVITGGAVAFINFFWNVGQASEPGFECRERSVRRGCLRYPGRLDRLPRRRQSRLLGDLRAV